MKNKLLSLLILVGAMSAKGQVTLQALDAINNTVPEGVTIGGGERLIASVYDTDYLPYTAPTAPADWGAQAADGTADTTVDVQGVIPTTGITVQIPITVTSSTTVPAYTSSELVIPAAKTQDGISRSLVLSWEEQSVSITTKTITATIKSIGGDLKIKKLDINKGVGNDYKGVLLGEFTYPSSSNNTMSAYAVRAISPIPDRHFGDGKHDFLYLPMEIDGEIYLNYNLGAEYANVNSSDFDLSIRKGTPDEKLAGSTFQWQRAADGHELHNSEGTSTKPNTWTPNNDKFVEIGARWNTAAYDHTNDVNTNLWKDGGINNPCPDGYEVPNRNAAIWKQHLVSGPYNLHATYDRFPPPLSYRLDTLDPQYWTSEPGWSSIYDAPGAWFYQYSTNGTKIWQQTGQGVGLPIRCIQSGQ